MAVKCTAVVRWKYPKRGPTSDPSPADWLAPQVGRREKIQVDQRPSTDIFFSLSSLQTLLKGTSQRDIPPPPRFCQLSSISRARDLVDPLLSIQRQPSRPRSLPIFFTRNPTLSTSLDRAVLDLDFFLQPQSWLPTRDSRTSPRVRCSTPAPGAVAERERRGFAPRFRVLSGRGLHHRGRSKGQMPHDAASLAPSLHPPPPHYSSPATNKHGLQGRSSPTMTRLSTLSMT